MDVEKEAKRVGGFVVKTTRGPNYRYSDEDEMDDAKTFARCVAAADIDGNTLCAITKKNLVNAIHKNYGVPREKLLRDIQSEASVAAIERMLCQRTSSVYGKYRCGHE